MVQSYRIHKLLSSLVGQHTCPVSFSSTPFLMHQCRVVTCTSNSNSCGLSPCNVIGYKIYVWRYSVKTCAKPRARSSAMFSQPQVSAWKTEFQSDIIWFNSWFAMVTSGSCACDHVPDKNSSIVPARHPGSSMCHKPNVSKLHTSTDVGPFPHHIFNYHKRRFQDQRLIYLSNRVILFQLASASNVWFQEGNQISHVETHLRSVQNPYGFIIRDCTTLSLSLYIYIYGNIILHYGKSVLNQPGRQARPSLPHSQLPAARCPRRRRRPATHGGRVATGSVLAAVCGSW